MSRAIAAFIERVKNCCSDAAYLILMMQEEQSMKIKAAVAFAAGKPLAIETVDLEGPKDGEVLVEIKASGVCHTDEFTRSGADPEGLFPVIFGHEGAGVVVEVGRNVTSVTAG